MALAACSTSGSGTGGPGASSPSYQIRAAAVGGLGTVLVNGQGLTLYLFEPDKQSTPTCTTSCAASWPPVVLPAGVSAPLAGGGLVSSLLGIVHRSDGSLQVTYDGWPLYRWIGDTRPGIATGEGLDNFGGLWYAVSPAGAAVTR